MHLKSHSGPIHVLLVNKDTEETSPVVVQVPPPKEDESENQNVDPNQAPGKSKPIKVRLRMFENSSALTRMNVLKY